MVARDQSIKRERSIGKINRVLEKTPKGFTEIQKETGLSPAGLNGTLKLMKYRNLVEKILVNNKEKYKLTKKGMAWFEKNTYLTYDIENIRERDGVHYPEPSSFYPIAIQYGFPWGIHSDIVVDKDIVNLKILQPKDVVEIEELVYKKIKKNIRKHKQNVENGKIVLGFSINYNEVIKSIQKRSLAYVNHISDEEIKIWKKYDMSLNDISAKDSEKLAKIRKKTYEKIKDLD